MGNALNPKLQAPSERPANSNQREEVPSEPIKEAAKRAQRDYQKAWAKKNPDKVKAYKKKWAQDNAQKIRDYQKDYRERNRDKVNAYHRKWYADHPGKNQEYMDRYWEKKVSASLNEPFSE